MSQDPEYLPPVVSGAANRPAVEVMQSAFQALMRGDHLPGAVEAREQRDLARDVAVNLEQENAKLHEVIAEYQRIIRELLDGQNKAREELILARITARMDLKLLLGVDL